MGIGCECCGLRKTAAGWLWFLFLRFFSIKGVKSAGSPLMLATPFEVSIYRPKCRVSISALLPTRPKNSLFPHARTPFSHIQPFSYPHRSQSIVEQSYNPGLSSLPNHIQTVFATVVFPRLVPLERKPRCFLFKVPVPDGGAEERAREGLGRWGITRYNKSSSSYRPQSR